MRSTIHNEQPAHSNEWFSKEQKGDFVSLLYLNVYDYRYDHHVLHVFHPYHDVEI